MKILILILFLGMIIMPVFAQESPLDDVSNQLENQINQDNLKELEQRVSNLENQPSFDDQFVSSTEYTKLMDRLYAIETKIENNNNLGEFHAEGYWEGFLEYLKDISTNLIATLVGAGAGFYISFRVTNWQKEKNRKKQKSMIEFCLELFLFHNNLDIVWCLNLNYLN